MPQPLSVKRREIKCFIHRLQYEHTRSLLSQFMDKDAHEQSSRGYAIRSLYFDDLYDTAVEDKLDGIEIRNKYRLRLYDCTQNWAKLERKAKHDQYVNKQSVTVSKDDCYRMIDGDIDFLLEQGTPTATSIYVDLRRKHFRPTAIIDYVREVYLLDYNDIRITFDKNLRTNTHDFDLFNSELETTPLQRPDTIIMEIKFNHNLPAWFKYAIPFDSSYAQAISKYCYGRMNNREFYFD